jgi:hypothetical protein
MSGSAVTAEHPSTDDEGPTLPGTPGARIQSLWTRLTASERRALLPHLIKTTPADWLAQVLTDQGHPIGATTIKVYRRSLRQNGMAQ